MDREKVIKGIDICLNRFHCGADCPYYDGNGCQEQLRQDALALLKEQEAVEPFHKCIGGHNTLIEDSAFAYCPYCGKPIVDTEGR